MAVFAHWAALLQIRSYSNAYVGWQWQQALPSALAANAQLRLDPIDVVKSQPDDLAGAQSKPRQKQQYGTITPPNRRQSVATVYGAQSVLSSDGLWNWRRSRPSGNRRHSSAETGTDFASKLSESQEGPQGIGSTLNGRWCHPRGLVPNERDGVNRKEFRQADLRLPKAPSQELSGHPGVRIDGGHRQRVIASQMLCELGADAINWCDA
jgi:hypothetical protein